MTLKRLSFTNPHMGQRAKDVSATEDQKNWQHLIENFKTVTRDLSINAPTGTPSIVNGTGTFTTSGPLVFFTFLIELQNGDGWTTSTNIYLPFTEAWSPTGTIMTTYGIGCYAFPVTHVTLGTIPSFVFVDTPPIAGYPFQSKLKFNSAYTNATGFPEVYGISGTYYRSQ